MAKLCLIFVSIEGRTGDKSPNKRKISMYKKVSIVKTIKRSYSPKLGNIHDSGTPPLARLKPTNRRRPSPLPFIIYFTMESSLLDHDDDDLPFHLATKFPATNRDDERLTSSSTSSTSGSAAYNTKCTNESKDINITQNNNGTEPSVPLHHPTTATLPKIDVLTTNRINGHTSNDLQMKSLFEDTASDSEDDVTTFTVATILEKQPSRHQNGVPVNILLDAKQTSVNYACSTVTLQTNVDENRDQVSRASNAIHKDDDGIEKLRYTSSLLDTSTDSAFSDDIFDGLDEVDLSAAKTPAINNQRSKTTTSSEHPSCNSTLGNQGSIFRDPSTEYDRSVEVSSKYEYSRSFVAKTPIQAPYDELRTQASTHTNLLDLEFGSEDEEASANQQRIQCRSKGCKGNRRISDQFLSVYDEVAAAQSMKSASFSSQKDDSMIIKGKQVKTFASAIRAVATGISTHANAATANARCDGVGSWEEDSTWQQHRGGSLSGKKRTFDNSGEAGEEFIARRRSRKSWLGRPDYAQMQIMSEEKEEQCDILRKVRVISYMQILVTAELQKLIFCMYYVFLCRK